MADDSTTLRAGQADHDALRELADAGNEKALDRLADLAHARNDVDELNELLDEGSELAGEHLTTRAIAARDLGELQRLADEGIETAEQALDNILDPNYTPDCEEPGMGPWSGRCCPGLIHCPGTIDGCLGRLGCVIGVEFAGVES